jgi:hypothetical protein
MISISIDGRETTYKQVIQFQLVNNVSLKYTVLITILEACRIDVISTTTQKATTLHKQNIKLTNYETEYVQC